MGILSFIGHFGVAVFFTLSGFLMAFLYGRRSFTAANAFSYAVSRFARIAPLYLCVIIASWLIRTYIDGGFIYDINEHNLLRHLFFSGSEGVFWSIPPEVQFYGFFLLLWRAVFEARDQNYRPAIITVILALLMLVINSIHPLPGTTLPSKLLYNVCTEETYYARNQAEIDAADEMVAFQVNGSAGTQDTIDKAHAKGLAVKHLKYAIDPLLPRKLPTSSPAR